MQHTTLVSCYVCGGEAALVGHFPHLSDPGARNWCAPCWELLYPRTGMKGDQPMKPGPSHLIPERAIIDALIIERDDRQDL